MAYVGKTKTVTYTIEGGRYHVTTYVTQGNWVYQCNLWFDSFEDLREFADNQKEFLYNMLIMYKQNRIQSQYL